MNEQNNRSNEFLNLYRTLEDILTNKYTNQKRKYFNAIIQYTNDDEGRKYKEELNLFREIRNLLSHHPEINGENVIEPSQSVIDTLREIIYSVENPPMAMTIATPIHHLVTATLNSSVTDIIKQMDDRGFSHIPILNEQILYGVFSVSTLFTYFRENGRERLETTTVMDHFKEFLPIEVHTTETFKFKSAKSTYYELKDEFSIFGPKKMRVAAIFITENGSKNKPLLGMITPWDLIRNS